MTQNPRAALRRRRKKRKRLVWVIAVLALALLAAVYWFFTREKPAEKATPYTADVYDPFTFALNDPDAPSIFEDSAYLALDRSIHIKRGMEEYTVSAAPSEEEGAERFFLGYFDALSHADTERYGEMFTDGYYQKYLPQEDFTEQRVYDIHLTWLDSADNDARIYYLVEYKISKNNGSFRRDIGPDASRPVVFELVRSGTEYRINDVHYVTK